MAHSVAMSLDPGDEEDTGVPTSKQRRATAKRKLERQLERRAKQARRNRIVTIAALAAVVIVVAGLAVWQFVFKKDSDETTTASNTTTTPQPSADANCQYEPTPSKPAAKPVALPKTDNGKVPTEPASISMSITTNQGPLGVMLDNAKAPCTVNSFVNLAQPGYFNDTRCHRLTTGPSLFVLQCGDPKGDGMGGPGYRFANEYPTNQYQPGDPALLQPIVYPRGTLAMANSDQPGVMGSTNGSQFFIVYKDSQLPPGYTMFGKVDEKDMAVIDKIAQAGTVDGSPDGKPKTDVVITSARVDN